MSIFHTDVSAQSTDLLDDFCAALKGTRLEMTYTYTARVSGIDNHGAGTLSAQGNMWKTIGNGIEMFCDAQTVWILDTGLKEMVIEPVADEASDEYITNPAVMLTRLHDLFKVSRMRLSSDGRSVIYTLHPQVSNGMDYFNVEISGDTKLINRASFAMSDGTLVKIEVSSMKLTSEISDDAFRPSVKDLDTQWIVTDLR